MPKKNLDSKKKQLDKIVKDFYKEFDKLEGEYQDLVNELIKRISERKLREIKKGL